MSASKYIKSQGLPSVQFVADSAGINRQLLHSWYNSRRTLFDVVVAGVDNMDSIARGERLFKIKQLEHERDALLNTALVSPHTLYQRELIEINTQISKLLEDE